MKVAALLVPLLLASLAYPAAAQDGPAQCEGELVGLDDPRTGRDDRVFSFSLVEQSQSAELGSVDVSFGRQTVMDLLPGADVGLDPVSASLVVPAIQPVNTPVVVAGDRVGTPGVPGMTVPVETPGIASTSVVIPWGDVPDRVDLGSAEAPATLCVNA